MIYEYQCRDCGKIIEREESMKDHSFRNPGPKCDECDGDTDHKMSGSPMFRLMWN